MQCQTCSAQIEPDAQFCPFCGTRVVIDQFFIFNQYS